MKRVVILVSVLLTLLASTAWAQQTAGKEDARHHKPVYYDTFKEEWLDPAKWSVSSGPCGYWSPGLECVREIQNGHLRLEIRVFGATDSDYGSQGWGAELDFVNPNTINSITADITQRSFRGIGCSTNDTDLTSTQVKIGGNFFNTGTGDPADDFQALLLAWVATIDPKTMSVNYWNNQGGAAFVDNYPIGTPLTGTIAWDKANHQFICVVKVRGDPGPGKQVVVPYPVSDTTPPASPQKTLAIQAGSLNCTSAKTFAQVEAFYDNVIINQPPPHAE